MRKVKVYIVEDDPMVTFINKKYIERITHFHVIGTSSAEEGALNKIQDLKPHLVFLDIYLPDGSGVNLLKQIRCLELPTDVICVTAASDSATVDKVLRLGAIDYILKPFDDIRMEQALNNYLQLRNRISQTSHLSQEDLDSLNVFEENHKDHVKLPKGLQFLTLEQILSYLLRQDCFLSCQQIATDLSISRITAWHYLEYLLKEEQIIVKMEYGAIGRPTKHYKIK